MSDLTSIWQVKTGAYTWRVYTPSGELFAGGLSLSERAAKWQAWKYERRMLADAEKQSALEGR